MEKNILIHIGAHKTGSSFLQQKVFPYLSDTYASGHPIIRQQKDPLMDLQSKLLFASPILINYDDESRKIFEYIEKLEENNILFSNESFFGNPFENYRDHFICADSLKQIFPKAKIFIVFRKQDDWIESLYKLTIQWGKNVKINDFLNYKKYRFQNTQIWSSFRLNFDVKTIDWLPYIENYMKLYGPENVLALPYELLVKDSCKFLEKFYSFSGIPAYYPAQIDYVNRGYSFISAYSAIFLNKLPLTEKQRGKISFFFQNYLDKKIYIPYQFIDEKKRNKIMKYYKNANMELEKALGINLQEYNYY